MSLVVYNCCLNICNEFESDAQKSLPSVDTSNLRLKLRLCSKIFAVRLMFEYLRLEVRL